MLFWLNHLPEFLLILVRIASFFVVAPIFSLMNVPTPFKVGLAFFISLVSFPVVTIDRPIELDLSYLVLISKEAIVGLSLGFVTSLFLYTMQIAGAFIDFQMGFMIANLVDPQTGAQVPIIGNLKYMLAILFLLSINGHHLLLDGVVRSYQLIRVDQMFIALGSDEMAQFITMTFVQVFLIAFQFAIPIVGSLFLVDVALGLLARTVPQVNVFVVGLPLKIFMGFCMLLFSLPIFFYLLQDVFRRMVDIMGQLIYLLGG